MTGALARKHEGRRLAAAAPCSPGRAKRPIRERRQGERFRYSMEAGRRSSGEDEAYEMWALKEEAKKGGLL